MTDLLDLRNDRDPVRNQDQANERVGSNPAAMGPRNPRPLAFVLSGGSASGAVQVGMLAALTDAGLRPDLIVGTSVGAVNGSLMAASPETGAEKLREIWTGLERADVVGSNRSLRTLSCLVRTRRHLFEADGLKALIREHLPARTFEDLPVSFTAVATNARTGSTALLNEGELEPAVLASAAIPGAFPRVEIDDEWYFDGGVTANVPVRQALQLGAGSLVVLDTAPPATDRELTSNIAGTIQHALSVMMRSQTSNVVDDLVPGERVIRLPAATPDGVGVFDFSRTAELIERGYETTANFLTQPDNHAANQLVVSRL